MENKTCPSAVCEEGASLIGVVNQDGIVDLLATTIPIDKEFVEIAFQGRQPELRFRFSNKCAEGGCRQWTGKSCGIIEGILESEQGEELRSVLPKCGIRANCRWFYQEGSAACYVCPLIITDNT